MVKMTEQDIEAMVADCIVNHRNNFETQRGVWTELLNRYENKLRENSITSLTDTKAPLGAAFALVENFIARLLNRSPKYKYLGRGTEDAEDAQLYEEFSEYQFAQANCEEELEEIGRWAAACGFAGWKIGWKIEKEVVSERGIEVLGTIITNPIVVSMAEKVGIKANSKKDNENVISNYTFKAIKPHDLIWNSDARRFQDVRIFGHKEMRYVKELKQEGYDTEALSQQITSDSSWSQLVQDNKGLDESQIVDLARVEVAEMYIKYLDKDTYKLSMMTMAGLESGKPVKIQFNERPFDRQFIPMGIYAPVQRLGKLYGFGLIEPVKGVIDAEEDLFNITESALWTDLARPMEYNPQNIMDMDSFEYGARKLVPVRQLGQSVRVMETPQPNVAASNVLLNFLQRAKQNMSGITDFQTGAEQIAGSQTLGEVKMKTAESNARIQKMIRNFERQVLEPMGRYALYLNKQYLAENGKMVYRIMGKNGAILEKAIKSKDVDAIKDIMIISGSTALVEQSQELQKWSAVLNQIYLEEKSANPTQINKEPIWERIFRDGLLQPDVETYLPNAKDLEANAVGGKMTQMQDAEDESNNPATARVLPTDVPEVHIPIHQAYLKSGVKANGQPFTPEEIQLLTEHLNAHTQMTGGMNPSSQEALAQQQQNQPQPPTV